MHKHHEDATARAIPEDTLAGLVPREVQTLAAGMAQDAFAKVFRLTVGEDDAGRARGVVQLADALQKWSAAAPSAEAGSLRLALLMAGLDQWGLAYSSAFGLQAIPGLTELLGALRTALEPQAEARLQLSFAAIDAHEGSAIDFKIALRRGIHIALWHAMIACDDRDQAMSILARLGGMLCALTELMPELGWRLVADAVAHIQIQCLAEGLATEGLARDTTEGLLVALNEQLPLAGRELAMGLASQTVLAWQQARRQASGSVH